MLTRTINLSDLKTICHIARLHYEFLQKQENKMFPARDKAMMELAFSIEASYRTIFTILNNVSE